MNNDLRTDANEWPERPETWPEIVTEIEVAMILRLDYQSIAAAKRSLRFVRRTKQLPDIGRLGRHTLFRRDAVFEWLAARERVPAAGSPAGRAASSGSADRAASEADETAGNAPDGPSTGLAGDQADPTSAGDSSSHLSGNNSTLDK